MQDAELLFLATTRLEPRITVACMGRPPRIHRGKAPHRIHYIPEWAAKRGFKKAAVARAVGVDKSSVTRWWKGAVPEWAHLEALAGLLGAERPNDLFMHPDEDWMYRLLRGR